MAEAAAGSSEDPLASAAKAVPGVKRARDGAAAASSAVAGSSSSANDDDVATAKRAKKKTDDDGPTPAPALARGAMMPPPVPPPTAAAIGTATPAQIDESEAVHAVQIAEVDHLRLRCGADRCAAAPTPAGGDGGDGDGDGHGDNADGAGYPPAVAAATGAAASLPTPSLRDLIESAAAKIDESEATHAAEKEALSARIASLEDDKRRADRRIGALEAAAAVAVAAVAADDGELALHTIARKWETLHTLANTLMITVRTKSVHAFTVRRDDDQRLSLASVRAVLDKFGGWKKWQVVLQPLRVKFEGEPGVDQGGLTRELFALLFDRLGDLDLFEVTSGDDLWRSRFARIC